MGHWGDTPGGSGGSGSGGGFGSSGLESRQSDFRPGETDSIDNKLRGFGRGRARGGKTAISVVGFESSGCEFGSGGGFGGGQSNGFNDNNNNKGFDGEESKRYGEGDLGACGGGFQSSGWGGGGRGSRDGAFGGSGGGGGDSRGGGFRGRAGDGGGSRGGGFGGSDGGFRGRVGDNEGRRGGGFGGSGGGGGSRACFKCGEEGHMSRDCPSGGGGGASRPSSGASINSEIGGIGRNGGRCGGGKDPGCHKCGELGHFARECPKAMAYGEKPKEIYIPPEPSNIEEEIFMHSMEKGINFNKFDDIPVECSGMDPPTSGIQRFEQMELNEIMKRNIVHAGYDRPTPIQKWAIPSILAGRDIMACAQTGSGKTAAFLVPVLTSMIEHGVEGSAFSEIQEPQAIVVGPTRELVVQTFKEARKFSYNTMIKPVVVYGGASVRHQMFKVAGGAHIVMGTPGRLIDFLKAGKISLRKLRYLVLDEADRMLDMGFLPQLQQIVQDFGMPGKTVRQTLMFSATFPENIQMLAQEYLNNYLFVTVGRVGGANTDIEQVVHPVPTFEKRDKIVSLLNQTSADKTLVFVGTKRQADYLASFLSQSEFPTTSIHGDREQREREEALADFKSGRAPVMVATSVAARGLDIPDVKHVINFDMPSEIDEYIHRIGRTGRCGNLGKATSFFNPESDGAIARGLVNKLEEAHQVVPAFLEEAAVRSYGTGGFTGGGGQYASKDTRKYRRGGGGSNLEGGGHSNGFGGGSMGGFGGGGGGDADEDWD